MLPIIGTWKRKLRRDENQPDLDVADQDVGNDFADSTSSGRVGMERRFSIVPRSRSRVIARPVIMIMVMVRTTPIRPGTMLYCVMTSGL